MFCFSFFYKTSPAANWYIHEEKEFVFNLTFLLTENCELPHKYNLEIMQKYLNWFFSPQLLDALKCRQLPAVVTIVSWSFAGHLSWLSFGDSLLLDPLQRYIIRNRFPKIALQWQWVSPQTRKEGFSPIQRWLGEKTPVISGFLIIMVPWCLFRDAWLHRHCLVANVWPVLGFVTLGMSADSTCVRSVIEC